MELSVSKGNLKSWQIKYFYCNYWINKNKSVDFFLIEIIKIWIHWGICIYSFFLQRDFKDSNGVNYCLLTIYCSVFVMFNLSSKLSVHIAVGVKKQKCKKKMVSTRNYWAMFQIKFRYLNHLLIIEKFVETLIHRILYYCILKRKMVKYECDWRAHIFKKKSHF